MKPRTGYSLIEAVAAIGISSVLASLALGLIGSLVRADHNGRRHLQETQSLARLAAQFRADVAAADNAALSDDSTQLELHFSDDRTAVYATEAGRATREEFTGGTRQRHESFVLPETARLAFEIDRARQPAPADLSLVRLSLAGLSQARADEANPATVARGARLGWRVEAFVGRALRWANPPAENRAASAAAPDEQPPQEQPPQEKQP